MINFDYYKYLIIIQGKLMNKFISIKQIMLIMATAVSVSLVGCATTSDKIDNAVTNITEQPLKIFIEKNGKFGFKRNGKVVIKAEYDYADGFTEGLAMVGKNGKYGFINKQGKLIIPMQYDFTLSFFSEGLASVKKMGNLDLSTNKEKL